MSAVVGVWKRTNGTLTDVLMIPDASCVFAIVVGCWATARGAVIVNTNNNPVFFMLPPPPSASGLSRLSLTDDKGYSRKVTSAGRRVKVTRVFRPLAPKVFLGRSATLMLHLRLHPCNIAPSLKTNGLGFFFHSRAPSSAHALAQGLPGPERRHG